MHIHGRNRFPKSSAITVRPHEALRQWIYSKTVHIVWRIALKTPQKLQILYTGRPCEVLSWVTEWVFPKWALSGLREQFLHRKLRKFRHSKSSVYRWYPQVIDDRFVYDTYRTMEATRSRHGWVHMFITWYLKLWLCYRNLTSISNCLVELIEKSHGEFFSCIRHFESRIVSQIS